MAHWRYGTPITPTGIAAASPANPEHPATNVLTITRPRRTYWTDDDTNGKTIDIDLGAQTVLSHVLIENTNAGIIEFQGSNNLSSFVTVLAAGPVQFDTEVTRGRGLFALTGSLDSFFHRYLRLILSSVRAPTPGHFVLGAMTPFQTITTAVRNYGEPFAHQVIDPRTALPYLGGGGELNHEGERYRRIELTGSLGGRWPQDARPDLDALNALGVGVPFVFDRNDGDPTHAYLVWLTTEIVYRDFGGARGFEAPVQLEEYI